MSDYWNFNTDVSYLWIRLLKMKHVFINKQNKSASMKLFLNLVTMQQSNIKKKK